VVEQARRYLIAVACLAFVWFVYIWNMLHGVALLMQSETARMLLNCTFGR